VTVNERLSAEDGLDDEGWCVCEHRAQQRGGARHSPPRRAARSVVRELVAARRVDGDSTAVYSQGA